MCGMQKSKERFPLITCPDCRTQVRHFSGSPARHRICPGCGNKFDPALCTALPEGVRAQPAPRSTQKTGA